MRDLTQILENSIEAIRGKSILIAVSGGADSMFLASALIELRDSLNLKLAIGNVDHSLREESAEESAFVHQFASNHNTPFFTAKLSIPNDMPDGVEAWAREERYRELERMRIEAGCEWIATAHHRNDQAETIMFKLGRGTGASGLMGIHEIDPVRHIIRPIINCDPKDMREYLISRGQEWREDPSNQDTKYSRNEIRHKLLPKWESMEPGITDELVQLAHKANAIIPKISKWARGVYKFEETGIGYSVSLNAKDIAEDNGSLLRLAMDDVWGKMNVGYPSNDRWNRIVNCIVKNKRYCEEISSGVRVWVRSRHNSPVLSIEHTP
jgi:tRNA(Ile)-lysidine synthetase-like protein